jgi:hypothetical protein
MRKNHRFTGSDKPESTRKGLEQGRFTWSDGAVLLRVPKSPGSEIV